MLPELGHFAAILALVFALLLSFLPLYGALKSQPLALHLCRPLTLAVTVFTSLAYWILVYAFISNDFSVWYVAQNSNSHLPWVYRFTAVWGAHEGSLLLWIWILTLWMLAVAWLSRTLSDKLRATVLSVMGMLCVGFLWFLLKTSNPFQRLLPYAPNDGQDLNPLLQDPGFVLHPPMLYIGYVGFSVVFAFAIAGLIHGRIDRQWLRWTRPWTLVAWGFLTIGIVLGSWWAYRELGWGGWWFWDPVENASLMPWLAGTALIHSLAVAEKRQIFLKWTVLLAILAFALSLLGTFLVRSGVLISVHAFAVDPARGNFILMFLALVIGGSLLLYAWRARLLEQSQAFSVCSRESLLLMNNILLSVAVATVLIGTLYPLLLQVLNLGVISVGPPYFNSMFTPLALLLLLVMGLGPQALWQRTQAKLLWQRTYLLAFALVIMLCVSLLWLRSGQQLIAILSVLLAIWVAVNAILDSLRHAKAVGSLWRVGASRLGMLLGHVGLSVMMIGIVISSQYGSERHVALQLNQQTSLAGYQFTFTSLQRITGPNYQGAEAAILVEPSKQPPFTLYSQKRRYQVRDTVLTKVGLDANLWRDVYVALGELMPDEASWSLRIYVKPLVRWIWLGGLCMMLGGFIAALDKRYRGQAQVKKVVLDAQ
jgi:cytochrome c-type biogenesis protein CcmF